MKKTIITVSLIIVLGLGAVYLASAFFFGNNRYFYTQIDNTKYTVSLKNNETYYTYTLASYDENGGSRELEFDTTRILRDSAFLKVKTANAGVLDWEEVQWSEIPQSAQEKLAG